MQHLDEGTIHAWIDGELSPEQASEVEAHASTCPECAAMVAEARGLAAAATRILTALDDVPGGVIPSVPDIAPAQVIRRRWYQRTDVRAAAALLFVAGASLLVVRRGTDADSSRGMLATADKGKATPAVTTETGRASAAEIPQTTMADATPQSQAATAAKVAESSGNKPLALNERSQQAATTSTFATPTSPSLQAKVMADARPSDTRGRDESQLSKEEEARTRAADVVNVPAPLSRLDAAVPSLRAALPAARSGVIGAGGVGGRVTDKKSRQGIANASVVVQGTTLGATTDKDGNFRIENVPEGARSLLIRRIGYQAETVPLAIEGRETAANVGLVPSPTTLEGVVVTSIEATPATAMLGASVSKSAGTAPLRVVRADTTGSVKRTVYEVSRGVEVALSESPTEAAAERDLAANDPARQKVVTPQSAGAAVDMRQRENALSGRIAGAVATPASALPLNSISWTERGRLYVLSGRLTTKDLEALKARLMQMRR